MIVGSHDDHPMSLWEWVKLYTPLKEWVEENISQEDYWLQLKMDPEYMNNPI